jgi:hypothetical protein
LYFLKYVFFLKTYYTPPTTKTQNPLTLLYRHLGFLHPAVLCSRFLAFWVKLLCFLVATALAIPFVKLMIVTSADCCLHATRKSDAKVLPYLHILILPYIDKFLQNESGLYPTNEVTNGTTNTSSSSNGSMGNGSEAEYNKRYSVFLKNCTFARNPR